MGLAVDHEAERECGEPCAEERHPGEIDRNGEDGTGEATDDGRDDGEPRLELVDEQRRDDDAADEAVDREHRP